MIRCLLAVLAVMSAPATAQVQSEFDVRFGGLRVAALILAAREDGAGYVLAGRADSTGLAGVFRSFRLEMAATGARDGAQFTAQSYREDVDTGRRASTVAMRWQDGVPMIDARSPDGPPETWDIDPATQTGTIDPLTALFALVRDRPVAELCAVTYTVFDGRRRSTLSLGPLQEDGATRVCMGLYTRIAGFSPEDLAERTEFPFSASFTQSPNGFWRLTSVELQSLYGAVRIIRTED